MSNAKQKPGSTVLRCDRLVGARRVVEYTACPSCSQWSIGVQANGRIVRHSMGCGSVEKVGPGTRRPKWRTTICPGSGQKVTLIGPQRPNAEMRDAPGAPSRKHSDT